MRTGQFLIRCKRFYFIFIIVNGIVNTRKYRFSPDCSFQICEKPSKFSKIVHSLICVCIVSDYTDTVPAWSTTTPTPCPHSQQLFQHVFVQSMVSAQSMTMHTPTFLNYIILNFVISFFLFQSKIISRVSAQSLPTLTRCR